ncbi:MAG TPA: hypothetical protein VJY62_03775 [Bacteroidia bacterium]|nr:hypothetical protein [Bacteroidia bacterium]
MDTLKLIEGTKKVVCRVLLFSGRKDTEWTIEDVNILSRIRNLIVQAERVESTIKNEYVKLGYRGIRLEYSYTIIEIYNGIIRGVGPGEQSYQWLDKNRVLEKIIIETLPQKHAEIKQLIEKEF